MNCGEPIRQAQPARPALIAPDPRRALLALLALLALPATVRPPKPCLATRPNGRPGSISWRATTRPNGPGAGRGEGACGPLGRAQGVMASCTKAAKIGRFGPGVRMLAIRAGELDGRVAKRAGVGLDGLGKGLQKLGILRKSALIYV